ncbi:MAG: phosphotransferase family protein, partial [Bacteroidetes bacterium]
MIDQPIAVRSGEELPVEALSAYLRREIPGFTRITQVAQFPGGFSNLTYLLQTNLGEWVLRRPPRGANIKSAHDMGREYRVLERLQGIYGRIPQTVHLCADSSIIGSSFYLMERVQGLILRNRIPSGFSATPEQMRLLSQAAIDNLAFLHQIDIQATGLIELGKPTGYVDRQVKGWT